MWLTIKTCISVQQDRDGMLDIPVNGVNSQYCIPTHIRVSVYKALPDGRH